MLTEQEIMIARETIRQCFATRHDKSRLHFKVSKVIVNALVLYVRMYNFRHYEVR